MNVLSIKNLSKNYKTVRALDSVSFSVPKGSIYGVLGPNGSGKTTLLGIITDVLVGASGGYEFAEADKPKNELRKNIGTLLETPNFYHYLSANDNLKIAAEIKGKGKENIDNVLKKVNLYERRNSKFSTFSLGMKQRLAIASAMLADPDMFIFDEPTNGLDPEGITEVREIIVKLAQEGKTVIMASHMLDEVEKVCTHVSILKKGKLVASGKVEELLSDEEIIEIGASDINKLYEIVKEVVPENKIKNNGSYITLHFEKGKSDIEALNKLCFAKGIVTNRLMVKKQKLEAAFLELTNSTL